MQAAQATTSFLFDGTNRWENGELFMGPDTCCDGLESRIADLTGRKVDRLHPVQGGYTNARRRIVRFRDGNTAFAKCATDRLTSAWLHSEISVYRQLSGDFMAAVLAWDEEEPPLIDIGGPERERMASALDAVVASI